MKNLLHSVTGRTLIGLTSFTNILAIPYHIVRLFQLYRYELPDEQTRFGALSIPFEIATITLLFILLIVQILFFDAWLKGDPLTSKIILMSAIKALAGVILFTITFCAILFSAIQ